ncbi:L-glyceraldehyde 3-phosphate reductase [Mycolicibacterium litorale]|uniref:Glyceraldehyde 3-phosphate reductase n=1 Tax=Mycolicibacterium litorale TaxID=758802 RepID=A0AAD1IIQ9_9MYCO|nr:L-glyceraldehyde 3-phosphate reductase [Mycolicibacterium litorale]MCV7414916.1 L-glyceraldehyde 3-phosphate reductase [Mycolicibacterium litorale]TDY08162.1 L-glyceraldehyde 3-phosphate reductase [Mycolicibacterium litorale]BBY16085.1 glyceraldehyde 3-phosphate reductase [Mycolicibacterium litorale]
MSEDLLIGDVPFTHDPWVAGRERYDSMPYRRVGTSGLLLPAISLGLWYNFGDNRPFDVQREVLRYAFDRGITHFDLANNYGPPYGSAEENFGRMLRRDFKPYRNELIISTKAGWDMWPGPYGQLGSRAYLLASLDESLDRLGLDYVDIFYSHRIDPVTPLEETIGALDTAVRAGKTRYVGISSYSAAKTAEAAAIAQGLGTPLVIHQPSYSLLNRWIEGDLTTELRNAGMGAIAFTALAQGLLTDRYLQSAPAEIDRATARPSFDDDLVTEQVREQLRGLAGIAERRGQTLAQLALAWVLRDDTVASTLVGASSVAQLEENLGALDNLDFSADELAEIDRYATESGIDLWRASSDV